MIVLSDGSDNAGCGVVQQLAQQASGQGILVIGVCVGPGCDVQCMRSIAASPRYFYEAGSASQLPGVFERIRIQLTEALSSASLATDELVLAIRPAPGMQLIDGSQSPGAPFLDADGRGWHVPDPPREGVTITFRVQPLVAGDLPVLASAVGAYNHSLEELVAFVFDVPRVVVASGGALPTATPGAPLGVPVAAHEIALVPANPAPGERASLSYHVAFDDPVEPQGSHVMLVVDASGSMGGEGNTAVKGALRSLVASLPLGLDPAVQVGLATFNSNAMLLSSMTDRRADIDKAIGLISASGGTCISCGIARGLQALVEARPAPGVEDLVVFTDGANNQGCGAVIDAADAAKADGVIVHAVCLLPGCDTQCMAEAASPGRYLEIPKVGCHRRRLRGHRAGPGVRSPAGGA